MSSMDLLIIIGIPAFILMCMCAIVLYYLRDTNTPTEEDAYQKYIEELINTKYPEDY